MDTSLKARMAPSLGLLVIAQVLRENHQVTLEDENIEPINYTETVHAVGITVTVNTYNRAIEISKAYREKGIPVIAGGIHISAVPELCSTYFDALCVGPSETIWSEIIADIKNNKLKKLYHCSQSISGNDIASPAYDLVDHTKYLYTNIISTSYGCPFRCNFCYNSCDAYNKLYINKPVENVLDEIKAINRKHIMFIDDNFIGNPDWTRKLLQKIKPLRLKWNAAVSANIINMPDILDSMQQSGCQGLFIGFESLTSHALDNANKNQNDSILYEKLVNEIHKRGMMVNASFVYGLDGEDTSVFQRTVDFVVKNKIETVTSHIFTPYPGTEVYKKLLEEKRINSFDYTKYDTAHVVFSPQNMTESELYDGYLSVYKKIYSLKNILRRIPRSKKQIIPYFLFNLMYRKYGKFTSFICEKIGYSRIGIWAERISKYI